MVTSSDEKNPTYLVVCQNLGPKDSEVAVGRLRVDEGMISHIGNVVGANEGNLTILGSCEDGVELANSIHEAWFSQVLCTRRTQLAQYDKVRKNATGHNY